MKFDLRETACDHRIIVAHRGVYGGNIPCNTIPSYETALLQGADMIETDLDMTGDGKLVIFHPKMEKRQICKDVNIRQMTAAEVRELRLCNYDGTVTKWGINTLDEVLEHFKGRCYINIDKFWGHPEEIYREVKRHGMVDQVLVKSAPNEKVLQVMEELAPEMAFMPIVKNEHPWHEEILRRNINYVGVEALFTAEDSPLAGEEFQKKMHATGQLTWVNSIVYNYKDVLAAGHCDDSALSVNREYGWGWLVDRGFDMIQTDWPQLLVEFLKETGRYYRK